VWQLTMKFEFELEVPGPFFLQILDLPQTCQTKQACRLHDFQAVKYGPSAQINPPNFLRGKGPPKAIFAT
jgi:hypothetical protein